MKDFKGSLDRGFKRFLDEAFNRKHNTKLTLDPETPGVGGQLGGSFEIHSEHLSEFPITEPIVVTIANHLTNRRVSPEHRHWIGWHRSMPANYTITPNGIVSGTFLFDLPEKCKPTERGNHWKEAKWKLTIQAEFAKQFFARGVIANWEIVADDIPKMSSISEQMPKETNSNINDSSSTYAHDPFTEKSENNDILKLLAVAAIFVVTGAVLVLFS